MQYSTTTRSGTTRKQVATYLDQGLTPRQIAALLGISTQAVYRHVKAIRQRANKEDQS